MNLFVFVNDFNLVCSFSGPHHGVDDDDSQEGSSRAQYVSANCVILTHYQGDAASVVDEHFSRALDKTNLTKGEKLKLLLLLI